MKNIEKRLRFWRYTIAVIAVGVVVGYGGWQYYSNKHSPFVIQANPAHIGQMISLDNVTVQRVNGDDIVFFVADADNGHKVLVFLNFDLQSKLHGANHGRLNNGQMINITGTIKAAETVDYMVNDLKMDATTATQVNRQGIYIDTTSVSAAP